MTHAGVTESNAWKETMQHKSCLKQFSGVNVGDGVVRGWLCVQCGVVWCGDNPWQLFSFTLARAPNVMPKQATPIGMDQSGFQTSPRQLLRSVTVRTSHLESST